MTRVGLLVDQLKLQALDQEEKYNQTSVLPISTYYLLCGLSEYLRIARTRLSGMLVTAAVEEAIGLLEKDGPVTINGQEFSSPAEFVRWFAHNERGVDELADKELAKREPAKRG